MRGSSMWLSSASNLGEKSSKKSLTATQGAIGERTLSWAR